ncbi:MAG: hypothetical protein R3B48_13700 [Kofleriaceae bacterium]
MPVEVEFELVTRFSLPSTAQPIQIKAAGAVSIRCVDPGVLVAQFIGLPFDSLDEGIRRSVARSVERMVAKLLTRRVVVAGTIEAITDPSVLRPMMDEIASYNPTAGAVFGVELNHFGRLHIEASDGRVTLVSPPPHAAFAASEASGPGANGWHGAGRQPTPVPEAVAHHDTQRGVAAAASAAATAPSESGVVSGVISGSISAKVDADASTPGGTRRRSQVDTLPPPMPPGAGSAVRSSSDAITVPTPAAEPPAQTPAAEGSAPRPVRLASEPDGRSSIIAVGARIGDGQVASGEILAKVEPGKRVLVPGPHGLMQSATVRQLLSGYYELEVGASGETIWVPMAHVVPE